jgi:hypothetical protein
LILVGGDHTIEARNLTESAADAGLRIRWLTFDGAAAQAALAAHGPGSVRLPLVIVANSYCFQQPQFQQIEACLDTLAVGSPELPPDCVRVVIAE